MRFFRDENPDKGLGFALPDGFPAEGLLLPHIQNQFCRVLVDGGSELVFDDIDWNKVVDRWDIKETS